MEGAGQQIEERPAIQSSAHWVLQHQNTSNYWLIAAFLCLPYFSHKVSCPEVNWRERASVAGECLTFQCLHCALKWHKKLKSQMRLQDYCPEKKKLYYIGMSELTWCVGGLKCWGPEQDLKRLQNAYFQVIRLLKLISLHALFYKESTWCLPCWWLVAEKKLGKWISI